MQFSLHIKPNYSIFPNIITFFGGFCNRNYAGNNFFVSILKIPFSLKSLYATQCRHIKFQKARICHLANARGFRSRAERNEVKRSVSVEILKFFKKSALGQLLYTGCPVLSENQYNCHQAIYNVRVKICENAQKNKFYTNFA